MSTKEEVKAEFETWLEGQPDDVKTLVNQRFEALTNTVSATRAERDTFKNELKSISKKVEVDSDAGRQIAELSNKLLQTEKRAQFIEDATKQGITRPGVAYSLASADNLFLEDGSPDWGKLKESIPELFKVQNTKTNAGSGTNKAVNENDPNEAFRKAAK